jgi:simple sugar transport system ATP-binding protein
VNFYIRGGEILGVAGIAGCGQKELCEAIAGLRPIEKGQMIHKGENIVGLLPREILAKGISMSFIPEDRLGMGLAPSLSITDNMILKKYADGKGPFVDRKTGRQDAQDVIRELEVVTPSAETPVRRLSGGNVQKVLLGREIKAKPNVIITAYPVRGLDIGSSYTIYNILNEQKKSGVGVLFVGEDLDVMMALCDKIMVLCHGRIMGVVHAHKTSKEELGLMMTGSLDLTDKYEDKPAGIAKDTRFGENAEQEGR